MRPAGTAAAVVEPSQVEAVLARALEEGRAAWPGIDVPAAELQARVRVALAGERPAASGGLHAADLYLACACALGLPGAAQAFVRTHLAAVPRYLAHLDPSPWLAEEVAQELALKLLVGQPPDPPRIASYGGRGPLESWVAVAAQRAALSLLRRRDPALAGARALSEAPLLGALSLGLDPEVGLARAEVKRAFEAALPLALQALGPRERMLLRLTLVSGLSCRKIGTIYGVNASTASRWISRARDEVVAHLERLLAESHGLAPEELASLLGLARSQIELSLSAVLGAD